jgi:hypothetical protein
VGAFLLYHFHDKKIAICVFDVLINETARNLDESFNLLEHLLHNLPVVCKTSRRFVHSGNRNDQRSHSTGYLLSLHPSH